MSKVTFEFDSVEDKDDIDIALNGYKWKLIVQYLDETLKNVTENSKSLLKTNTNASKEEIKIAELLRAEIRNALDAYELNMY